MSQDQRLASDSGLTILLATHCIEQRCPKQSHGDDDVVSVYSPTTSHSSSESSVVSVTRRIKTKQKCSVVSDGNKQAIRWRLSNETHQQSTTTIQCASKQSLREGQSALQYADSGKRKLHPPPPSLTLGITGIEHARTHASTYARTHTQTHERARRNFIQISLE